MNSKKAQGFLIRCLHYPTLFYAIGVLLLFSRCFDPNSTLTNFPKEPFYTPQAHNLNPTSCRLRQGLVCKVSFGVLQVTVKVFVVFVHLGRACQILARAEP